MKKIIILVGILILAGAGMYAVTTISNDYEVVIADEVSDLENELAALDVAVANGTLTSAQAVEARDRITEKLASINASLSGSGDVKLTAAQQLQLQSGLQKLKEILIKYQSTLVAVDVAASADTSAKRHGGGSRSLTSQFVDAVNSVEDIIEDVVDEYVSNDTTDDLIDEIDDMTGDTIDEIVADEVEEDNASSTDEMIDDETGTSSDEEAVSDESTIEIEAEAEAETPIAQ